MEIFYQTYFSLYFFLCWPSYFLFFSLKNLAKNLQATAALNLCWPALGLA
jgi:hypothetical protein